MKTVIVTKQIGEWLGPIDWNYDFDEHSWKNKGCVNPECIADGKEALHMLINNPGHWMYSPSFLTSFKIVEIGMYDGWPFWRPTPAIGYIGPLGEIEVSFYYELHKENLFRRK